MNFIPRNLLLNKHIYYIVNLLAIIKLVFEKIDYYKI